MIDRALRAAAAGAILLAAACLAQGERLPIVPGEPAIVTQAAPAPRLRLATTSKASRQVALPPVSDSEVDEVRKANARGGFKNARRLVIGLARPLDAASIAPDASGLAWVAVAGGRAARASLASTGAASLRISLELAGVPEDVEMVFFGSDDPSRLEGPVRVGDIRDRTGAWWSPITEGDTQTIEFFVPSRYDPRTLPLRLTGASHIFGAPSSGFGKRVADIGSAGSCNVDVICSALDTSTPFQNIAHAAAQMVFTDGNFIGLCSGTLVNDADTSTQVPWFYSANHCFDNDNPPYKTASQMQTVGNTLATLWSFEASACVNGKGNNTPVSNWSQLNGGAAVIASNPQSDVLFLRLNGTPPAGSFFAGFDPNPMSAGAAVITVHHPEGDLKKVTQGTTQGFSAPGVGGGSNTFISVRWSLGTTEPGSSGGGLFTFDGSQYLLRGGLWGGDALCTNMNGTDNFSRFDQIFSSAGLAQYLAKAAGPGGVDYTDLWWGGASESGWGMNLIQHPSGIIFAVWFTYGADGQRTWFFMSSGTWTSANVYTGAIYATTGPAYTAAFDPSLVRVTPVGTGTFTFSDANNGVFTFTVNGASGSKTITRPAF
jgi:lysyl endopeptidase